MEHFVTVMIQMIPYVTARKGFPEPNALRQHQLEVAYNRSTVEVDVGFVTPNLIVGDIQMSGTSDCKTGTAKLIATETDMWKMRYAQQSRFQTVNPQLQLTRPSIIDSSPELVEGVHVFEPEQVTGECTSDITYIAPSSMSTGDSFKLCLTVAIPGKRGEERCFTITVENNVVDKVSGPCKNITCHGGSKCVSDLDSNNGQCVCAKGFSGADCLQVTNTSKDLPGVINHPASTPDAPHFDGSSALPKTTNCQVGNPCKISVPYIGFANKPPVPGKCDLIILGNSARSLGTSSLNHPSEHMLMTTVNASSAGSHRCCFQTTTNGTKEGDQVRQCGNGLPGSHVFTTNLVDNACVTDISYHTSTSTVMPLCVTAGAKGEQRTFLIETKITNEYGKCQKLHCMNGGTCLSDETAARCQCPPGRTGQNCSIEVNECESNPCKNGGSCTDLESSFACNCAPGYTGTNCQLDVDECFQVGGGSPCQHGGQCVNDNSMYICNCSNTGYTGKNCQNDVDDCVNHACENGATCVDGVNMYLCSCPLGYTGVHCLDDGDHAYTCVCVPGYTGPECQEDIDDCSNSPCKNGGSCTDALNDFSCSCVAGFTDKTCSTIDSDDCQANTCENGGTCLGTPGAHVCKCGNAWAGPACTGTNLEQICNSTPCQNGATCIHGVNSYTCHCKTGYSGANCEHGKDKIRHFLLLVWQYIYLCFSICNKVLKGELIMQPTKTLLKSICQIRHWKHPLITSYFRIFVVVFANDVTVVFTPLLNQYLKRICPIEFVHYSLELQTCSSEAVNSITTTISSYHCVVSCRPMSLQSLLAWGDVQIARQFEV
ncbi:FBP1-like protein [Mya arenaria]|uniref:FBP1-like protein n=1 Tax=Mya arenaria TaxID=6604 RepID=A0ABY7F8W6_MYAAR|nr:FBP1-like protein [Mya arenaria]